jgi:rRNA maturation RNase YbeY
LTKLISFNEVDSGYTLRNKTLLRTWIIQTILNEHHSPGEISFNFCSDNYLLKVNKTYLAHDFFTDIITFDLSENGEISGDVYISIDRVHENSVSLNTTFHVELNRVIIHGVLHLCGYKDKTKRHQGEMRKKEDHYLSLLSNVK